MVIHIRLVFINVMEPLHNYRPPPPRKDMDDMPFLWKHLREERGYVTQWAEDGFKTGTYSSRLVGFRKQPVHHYMRNHYVSAGRVTKCQGRLFSVYTLLVYSLTVS